jgi:tetrahydromethanopterin S-methyltransferase subunit G
MKTTHNHTRISRISMVFCSAIAFGSVLYAQPHAGSDANNSDEVYNRLETLMASTEEAVKYVAPSVEADEINEAMESLELLANNIEMAIRYEAPTIETAELNEAVERLDELASSIENEIRYRVPVEEQANVLEYAENDNNKKTDANFKVDEFLTYNSVSADNK